MHQGSTHAQPRLPGPPERLDPEHKVGSNRRETVSLTLKAGREELVVGQARFSSLSLPLWEQAARRSSRRRWRIGGERRGPRSACDLSVSFPGLIQESRLRSNWDKHPHFFPQTMSPGVNFVFGQGGFGAVSRNFTHQPPAGCLAWSEASGRYGLFMEPILPYL